MKSIIRTTCKVIFISVPHLKIIYSLSLPDTKCIYSQDLCSRVVKTKWDHMGRNILENIKQDAYLIFFSWFVVSN